jgi:hypothetical protein
MQIRRFSRAFAVAAALLLAGCANIDAVSTDRTDLDPKLGYALVSLSHSGYGWLESLSVNYRKRGDVDFATIAIVPRTLYRNPEAGVLLRDGEKRMIGELKLLALRPGDYEFTSWYAIASAGAVGLTLVQTSWRPVEPPPPIAFSVSAGKITYIGNLDIMIPSPKRYRWRGVDERARDLGLLEKRFAAARLLPAEVKLMQGRDGAEFEGASN